MYANAVNGAQWAPVVAAATYPSAVLESGLLFVFNILVLAAAILIIGLLMRNGVFRKSAAYLGMFTGILGVVSVVNRDGATQ